MNNQQKNEQLLTEALNLCQNGKLSEAKLIYDGLIDKLPDNLAILVNLGIVEIQLKNVNKAISLFKRAIQINPGEAYIHSNLGNAFLDASLYEDAIKSYDEALTLDSNHFQAYYNKGRCLKASQNFAAAIESYSKAIEINSNYAEAYNNLGVIFYEQKNYDKAITYYEKALTINYEYGEAYNNLGLVFLEIEKFDYSIKCFSRAIEIDGNNTDAIYNLARNLEIIGKPKEGLILYNRLLVIHPNHYMALYNKSKILIKENSFTDAKKCLKKAIRIQNERPEAYNAIAIISMQEKGFEEAKKNLDFAIKLEKNFAEAYNSMGILYQQLNEHERSIELFKKAIDLEENYSQAKFNLSEEYLSKLNFAEGWKNFESRINVRLFKVKYQKLTKKYLCSIHDISSEDSIYIEEEQGIGDQILFLSLLSEFKNFKNKIYVRIDRRLKRIFANNFKEIIFLTDLEDLPPHLYSYHLSLGTLGMLFRPNVNTFSKQKLRYLDADPNKTNSFINDLKNEGISICGLSWRSSNKNIGNNKSIQLESFLPILSLENLKFIDLQYDDTLSERNFIKKKFDIDIDRIEDINNFSDMDGLFSLIDSCDFIVTVSNVTAHIAGALGKKTFLLVPFRYGRIWYWHEDLNNSLWYPSITIYRQDKNGNWGSAINQIKENIKSIH